MTICFLPLAANTTASYNHKKVKLKKHYSTLALEKNLFFTKFSCFSTKSTKDVQVSLLLRKLAKAFDNLLPTSPAPAQSSVGKQAVKRIKMVITKQQLKELSSNRTTLKDLLSCGPATTLLSCITSDSKHVQWKPKLKSIPEGNEL